MPTLNLPSPFSGFGDEYLPIVPAASAPGTVDTIEGIYPYATLSDYSPGGFNHPGHRTLFLPGCFSDFLRLVATNSRLSVALLVGHSYERELASTSTGTLRVWEDGAGLHWKAKAKSPIPVRFCSLGCGNYRSRLHTFRSGEVVRVVERSHLLEVSLVEKPATLTARAWTI